MVFRGESSGSSTTLLKGRDMKNAALGLLAIVLLGLGSGLARPARAATEPAADLSSHDDEPFIIERSARSYRFEADGTGRTVVETRVLVQSETGVQQLGQLLFPYVSERSRLELDFLRVHRPDGSVTDGSPDLLQDLPAPVTAQFPVYSDVRMLHVTVPSFRPGDILELRLTTHLETPDAPDRFWMADAFERNAIVLEETIEVDVPEDEWINLYHAEGMTPEIHQAKGRRTYRWTHANTARQDVSHDAARQDARGYDIELSNFRDWQDVGAWYSALQGDRASPDRAIRRQAEKLTADLDNDRARVEAIYTYVATEFRYLALLFGAGRYQPHPGAEVLKNGYGDCKDKHTLLAALLQAAGFQASPVLIGTLGEPTEDVPSPHSFDHMITAVSLEGSLLLLDSTQSMPFAYLNPALRGKQALLIPSDTEARLVTVPDHLPFPTSRAFSLKGEVDEAGHLRGKVEHLFRGDEEAFLRATFLNTLRSEWGNLVQALNIGMGLAGEISDLKVGDPKAIEDPLKLSYTLVRSNYLNRYRQSQKIDLMRPPAELPEAPAAAAVEAAEPMELGELSTVTSRIELTLPAGFEARAPVAVTIDRDFASYQSRYAVEDRRLVVEHEIELKQRQLAPERFREWAALRETAQADGEQSFTLRRSRQGGPVAAEATDIGSLLEAGYSASKAEDYETAVSLFSRVVELEPEHATAWYRLGKALVKSGEGEKGVEALRRQIEIDPFHQRVHNNLGWALEEVGDPTGAEAAYRAQLERYPLNHYANAHLGELLDEQERCGEALPSLESALSIKSDDHKSRMRLGRCYLRLGRRREGVATLEPLVESSKTWPLHAAGYAAIEHQAYDTAILLLRRVTELDPDHAYAFTNLGRALRRQGRLDEAVAALRRQIEIEPEDRWAYDNLGRVLSDQGKYSEAIVAIRRHLEIIPDDTGALWHLSKALWHSEQLAEAVEALRQFVGLEPADSYGYTMLGVALFSLNRFDEAAEALEKALAINAEDPVTNGTLGVILARQERYAEALPLLEKALAIAPEHFRNQDILDHVREKVSGGDR